MRTNTSLATSQNKSPLIVVLLLVLWVAIAFVNPIAVTTFYSGVTALTLLFVVLLLWQ